MMRPRQLGQHSTAPFLPPRPSHLSQITFFCRASFLVAPLYRSSKVTETILPSPSLPPFLFAFDLSLMSSEFPHLEE
uniref:Uncharacterized protein n=1 Tax=Canis lupus dingo TaxID=286419 RepID=A0A8C0KN53_CANLU